MTQQYRLIIHCDENRTNACKGFTEYASPDRLDITRKTDEHLKQSGWLRGYTAKGTYDVCPPCREKLPPWGRPEAESVLGRIEIKAEPAAEKPSD